MTFQSHSYNMHRGGGNIGHGGIFPVMEHDEAVADLQKSIEIGGNGTPLPILTAIITTAAYRR